MSEERSIYDFGSAGISILEQEIVKRDAELASLRQRAERAEADSAALREALEQVQNILDRGQEIGADDVPIYALTDIVNPVLIEHPGAALQSELAQARAIVTTLRMHRDAGGEVWHSIDADLAAYDAAKGRAE